MHTVFHLDARRGRAILASTFAGALMGAACLMLAFKLDPGVSLEMDRDVPRILSGFHEVERYQDETFAWTSSSAGVRLPGLDRRIPWVCSVRYRGGRPPGVALPNVDVAADGVRLASVAAAGSYQDLEVAVPARPSRAGVLLTIATSSTFVPGPSDSRELGVQVDRVSCRPAEGLALPPRRAMTGAVVAGAAFGAAFALVGLTVWGALGGALLVAAAQAVALTIGPALYTEYVARVPWIAIGIVIPMMLGAWAIERWHRQPLHRTAGFVMAYSSGALYLILLGLLHPSKALIDAVFHAHRLEWVLAGRYYFTQAMPDGVAFPYAIALYLFASPFVAFTQDHVALLRIVVSTCQILAGALLYPMIVRTSGDRVAGATAVVLFSLVPLAYVVVGNANLTNAFGHSAALVTMVAATAWPLGSRDVGQLAGLFVMASVAFLSHVSTFPLLLASLLVLAALYRWFGGLALRAPARSIFFAALAAALFSVVAYYGQFDDAYKSLDRVRRGTEVAAAPTAAPQAGESSPAGGATSRRLVAAPPLHIRALQAVALGPRAVGWPIAVLALLGAWRLTIGGGRDRLRFTLLAWWIVYVVFLVSSVVSPVGATHYRYVVEFIDRVNYATVPAAIVSAAFGAAWAWRAGMLPRIVAVALVLWAFVIGVQHWLDWLR